MANFCWPMVLLLFLFAMLMSPVMFLLEMETPIQRFAPVDSNHYNKSTHRNCYDPTDGRPQLCLPDFTNVAFQRQVEVSPPEFTCGVRQPNKFCVQTGNGLAGIAHRTCSVCDNRIPSQAHPPSLLTDFNDPTNESWWQSVTMEEGVHKERVNLTLRLGKSHNIAYVRLKFASPRPESFAIYKRTRASDPWTPWQFYSGSCLSTFKLPEKAPILPGNEAMAQCTREFSDISPLTGGNIAFATLEGRPSAENFEESEVLQEWVTATEILISLVRLNTFGDEIFLSQLIHRTYYYAISDFAVGGWCKCNGHANQCVKSTGQGAQQQLVCDCQHNTAGIDCEQCAPFHMDRPWRPATSAEANECLPCQCNGLSHRCFFDAQLFEQTGHGGHCIDCAGNTQGPNCDQCVAKHWRPAGQPQCRPCTCDPVGSVSEQCDESSGHCECKPGVGGPRCDQCMAGFFGFGSFGCKECQCNPAGSALSSVCSPNDGHCVCKFSVEGSLCERCKPGYFLLSGSNPFGCLPCFCFGHSSLCSGASGFYARNISAEFIDHGDGTSTEGWTARTLGGNEKGDKEVEVNFDDAQQAISAAQQCDRPVYFTAPPKFLGDQHLAYGQWLRFSLRKLSPYAPWSSKDLQLVGANGRVLSLPLGAQGNAAPSSQVQHYQFRIHADPALQWSPQLREIDFIGVLSNLSAIRVRATFSRGDVGFLSAFSLGSASEGLHPDQGIPRAIAPWVEQCQCPPAHSGQFCQHCAPGFKRAQPLGGPLTKCVPCQCNGHAQLCEAESGACHCEHNTAGDTCERCARGFFGNALAGTVADCKPCDCPEGGPCILLEDGQLYCTECPEGYTGPRCEYCAEDHFGDPALGQPCQRCNCSGNVDPNAIGQCDSISGECRRCIHHTVGWHCEQCAPGFWGDALADPLGQCQACNCYAPGSQRTMELDEVLKCSQADGQCSCLPNVVGQRCDRCALGFFNITSGTGCQPCGCDPLGTLLDNTDDGNQCDMHTGQCHCKNGVTGLKCDQCEPKHFAFGASGCSECVCHPQGAESTDCDIHNGQCLCRDWVEGRRCDRCAENRHDLEGGCPPCEDCYSLIQNRKVAINGTITELAGLLADFRQLPIPPDSVDSLFGQLDGFRQRIVLQADSKVAEQFGNAKAQLDTAFAHMNASKASERALDIGLDKAESRLAKWRRKAAALEREIANGMDKLQSAGDKHLEEAKRAALLSERAEPAMSEMAAEASELVQRQEGRVAELRQLALKVAEKTAQAAVDAELVIANSSISPELVKLGSDVTRASGQLTAFGKLTKELGAEANETADRAALLLANSQKIAVPMGSVAEDIFQSLASLKDGMKQIGEAVDEAKKQGAEVEKEARDELEQSRTALQSAWEMVEAVEEEHAIASRLEKKVLDAVKTATHAFEEAEANWRALARSPEELAELKAAYEREMDQSGELAKELAESEARMDRVEAKLKKAQRQANRALKMALSVERRAEAMAKPIRELNTKAETLAKGLKALTAQMDELEKDIEAEELEAMERLEQGIARAEQMEEALREAASAEQKAIGYDGKAEAGEQLLTVLLERLDSVKVPSDAELNALEAEVEKLEKSLSAELEMDKTRQKIGQLSGEKSQFQNQISVLKEELASLGQIALSLPTQCFNVVRIEQNGQ